jgi:hypothetical protein
MGMAIAFEPPEPDVMRRPPRPANKRLFGKQALWRCFFVAGLMIAAILGQFQIHLLDPSVSIAEARAEAFTTLISAEIFYVFNVRFANASSLRSDVITGNKWVLLSCAITAGLQVLLVHTPGLNGFFGNAPIDAKGWGRAIGFGAAVFVLVEVEKYLGPRYVMPVVTPIVRAVRRFFFVMLRCGRPKPSAAAADSHAVAAAAAAGAVASGAASTAVPAAPAPHSRPASVPSSPHLSSAPSGRHVVPPHTTPVLQAAVEVALQALPPLDDELEGVRLIATSASTFGLATGAGLPAPRPAPTADDLVRHARTLTAAVGGAHSLPADAASIVVQVGLDGDKK